VILDAAGKFTVLAPNTPAAGEKVGLVNDTVNQWLFENTYGEVSIGVSAVTAAHEDFLAGNFRYLWDRMVNAGEEKKFTKIDLDRYGGAVAGYLDGFDNTLESPLCPLCGKRPAARETSRVLPSQTLGSVCPLCRDHVFLGTHLVREQHIIISGNADSDTKPESSLMAPVFGRYDLQFAEADELSGMESTDMLKCWDLSVSMEKTAGITRKFLNGYVPVYQEEDLYDDRVLATGKPDLKKEEMIEEIQPGMPKTFGHIAARALSVSADGRFSGIDALGVLKADVDSLGLLLSCGLPDQRHTISRLATLSRQINYFFTLYLPEDLAAHRRFRDIYTVFAGGDDLFLIGPWNRIHELSLHLEDSFGRYVCRNPEVHFSAGISLHKAHAPLDRLAASAEGLLERSKNRGRNRLSVFSRTVEWSVARELETVRREMESWIEKKWISRSMLYRLNHFIDLSAAEKSVVRQELITIADMVCLKWRSLFFYSAERNIGKNIRDARERKRVVNEVAATMADWLARYAGALRIPLWIVLYNMR
jgi:CRISPR-associated protein Csm1